MYSSLLPFLLNFTQLSYEINIYEFILVPLYNTPRCKSNDCKINYIMSNLQ